MAQKVNKKDQVWNELNVSHHDFMELAEEFDITNYEDKFMNIIALFIITFSMLGILANILIVCTSYSKIKTNYRHFIANLAVVDIACCLVYIFMGYINILDLQTKLSVSMMTYSALAFYGSFGVMIWAVLPISISRVLALTHSGAYKSLCYGGMSIIFCLLADFLPVTLLYIISLQDYNSARITFIFYGFITVVAYVIAFVSNYMVFQIVARHIHVVQNLQDEARLLETRQVAFATLAQAIVPLICQVPAFLTLSSAILLTEPITNSTIITITQLWLASSPLLDALITAVVIKQYRKQWKVYAGWLCSILRRTKQNKATLTVNLETNLLATQL
ncbi:unnamed protein product [Auanema sp. JU1783]|nr:unnamed protein product [Auanema sp. JU1783]